MIKLQVNPKLVALYTVLLVIFLYIIFQARFVIFGPRISIYTPKNNEVIASSTILVTGHAENIAYITLDDRPIFVDEKGNFNEKIIAQDGMNFIKLWAKDRFNRATEKTLRIVYNR
ncbi:MAG: hypothetical protein WAV25_00840 [Minisyncoccia bacterium]